MSVNNISSDILPILSVLWPLLFLIHINDLNNAVEFTDVHHFAHDTNILCSSKSLKHINKKKSILISIIIWLRTNKILLNADQTELVLIRSKNKKITRNMNFRINEQKMKILSKKKYLGLFLDKNFYFKNHLDTIKLKLNMVNCLLSKIRHYV